jgi:uncharacterized protein (TIGR00369 family)
MAENTLLSQVRKAFEDSVFQRRLGVELESVGVGEAIVRLPLHRTNANRSGNLHGGAHASLLLSAASLATASSEREPSAGKAVSPRSLAISYLGAARRTGVRAHAKVVRRGRDVAHVSVVVDSEEGDAIAVGNVTVAVHDRSEVARSMTDAGTERKAALFGRVSQKGDPVEGSPFLEESGLVVLSEQVEQWQSLLIPTERNEECDQRIDDGAVVGLVDNCGSWAAYTAEGLGRESLGSTLSMSVVFASSVAGPLIGSGRLLSHLGTALTSEVEIWSPADGSLRATGLVTYRIARPASIAADRTR